MSYADLRPSTSEITGTQGQPAEPFMWSAWWEKSRKWIKGEWCPHDDLHHALLHIALALDCPVRPHAGLNTLLDVTFDADKRPPDNYWGDKL